MSESVNKELIAEARTASIAVFLATDGPVADDLSRILQGLANALESATKVGD
jgi:small-conductance mechanosensitive channel